MIEFDNKRKCMSVLVKRNDKYILFWKGADEAIKGKLSEKSRVNWPQTNEKLEILAKTGLRTLVIAYKCISAQAF